MKNRKEKVKQKLRKIREANVQKKKYERETNRLQRQMIKLSNKSTRLFNPPHLPGNFVRAFTELSPGTIVRYVYKDDVIYGEVKGNDIVLILHESELKTFVNATFVDAKFKNGKIIVKKLVDSADTEVIMV